MVIGGTLPASARTAAQKPAGRVVASFEAFGRRFDLELESNDRVLRKLGTGDLAKLPSHTLYRGQIAGQSRSWVRLTALSDGMHGLISDGVDIYVVAPTESIRSLLDTPLQAGPTASTSVYRAADADANLGIGFCQALEPPAGAIHGAGKSAGTAAASYKSVLDELAANAAPLAAATATKELDIALVGDVSFSASHPGAAGDMLVRLNNVDGIFSSQVGVTITTSVLKVLSAASDGGLSSGDAGMLLDQFEVYRKATPDAASRGLAHLLTGRDLDGSTVGIAYRGTVCERDFAVSLSQQSSDSWTGSLIMAHELGHNFGAPHDGTAGSACAGTAMTFLMSPQINGSSTFSQCSLSVMAPVVSAAACLTAKRLAEVAVEVASANVSGFTGQDVASRVDVVSSGTDPVDNVVVTIQSDAGLVSSTASSAGSACATGAGTITCQLGTIAPGVRRAIDITQRGLQIGDYRSTASVTASADSNAGNNSATFTLSLSSPADGTVAASPAAPAGEVGQVMLLSVTATNLGPQALAGARVILTVPATFQLQSLTPESGACTTALAVSTCTFGSLPSGSTRRISLGIVPAQVGTGVLTAELRSDNDSKRDNDTLGIQLTATQSAALEIAEETGPTTVPLGGTISRLLTVHSRGTAAANDVTVTVSPTARIQVTALTSVGAQCGPQPGSTAFVCRYGAPIEAGGTREVTVQVRGTEVGTASLDALVQATGTIAVSTRLALYVASGVDVSLSAPSILDGFDHRPSTLTYVLQSVGTVASDSTQFSLRLPAGVRPRSARSTLGSCTISDSAVGCAIGTLRPQDDALVTVSLVSDVTGSQPLEATVSAAGDSNKSNDNASTTFKVDPNVDIGIGTLPVQSRVRVGSTVDYVFSLVTATQSVASATARVSSTAPATIVTATPSQGSCSPAGAEYVCAFGVLPANAEPTVTVRLRGEQPGFGPVTIVAAAGGDVDPGNSTGSTMLDVDARGNVSIAAAQAGVTTAVGTAFDLPTITLTAITQTVDIRVNLSVPASFTVESALASGAPCAVNAGSIACSFGTLPAGATRGVNLRLRANQSGAFSTGVNATAEDDSDMSNNSTSIAITVNGAPPPNPAPTGNVSIATAQGNMTATVGAAFDLPTISLTAIAQTADVRVNLTIPASFTVESVLAGGAPCAVNAGSIACSFGTLPAGTTRSVNVRLRANQSGAFSAGVTATAESDSDPGNDSTSIGITVNAVPPPNPIPTPTGNVSVAAAQGSVTATVGTAFDLPTITLTAIAQTADVRINLSVPASLTVENALADGAPCTVSSGSIVCSLGTLPAGTTRSVNLRLRANQSGAFVASVNATAEFDLDATNNSMSIAVIVNAVPPNPDPKPNPIPNPSPSGGGGGGAADWLALLAMLGLAARVRTVTRAGRRRESRP